MKNNNFLLTKQNKVSNGEPTEQFALTTGFKL